MVSGMTREAFQNHQSLGNCSGDLPETTATAPLRKLSRPDTIPVPATAAVERWAICSNSSLALPRLPMIVTKKTPASPASSEPMRRPPVGASSPGNSVARSPSARLKATLNAPAPVRANSVGTARLYATHGTMPVSLISVPIITQPK